MKLTRPLIASATAIAIAAGSVPAFAQDNLPPAEQEQVLNDENQLDTTEIDAYDPEQTNQVKEEGSQVTEITNDAPEQASGVEIRELTKAPLNTATKKPQKWFKDVEAGKLEAREVWSPSMGRWIPVAVHPAGVDNAPTVYLLNGAGGSEQDTDWINLANKAFYDTYGDESVNVVIPMEGAFSYYVDWDTNPGEQGYYKGEQKWSTFLSDELPQIEKAGEFGLNANDKRAIVGFSMSATSSLLAAQHNPGFYDAVGSFSGCAATSTPLPYFFTGLTVARGANGMTPESIWGPQGSASNRHNDALVNAEKLAGTALYISSATGLQSESDMFGTLLNNFNGDAAKAFQSSSTLTIEGGVIEAAMNACTHDLKAKLDSKNIPAHYELRNTGTHSWPGWREDLKKSWDLVIKPALLDGEGAPATNSESASSASSQN